MSLRSDWKRAKETSEFQFKQESKPENQKRDIVTEGFVGYPVKFNKDLGPALDDWEKANGKHDNAGMTKAKVKAQAAYTHYLGLANQLPPKSKKFITDELQKIKNTLGLH